MELNKWCNSGSGNSNTYAKNGYDRVVSFDALVMNSEAKTPRWRLLWRKIMKEKKKIFDCSSTTRVRVHFSYDPYAYSQNFDQGSMWSDPDNISRSFSARFAVPSRIFQKNGL